LRLPLEFVGGRQRLIGAIVEVTHHLAEGTCGVEDVGPAGCLGQGPCLAGPQALAPIGDDAGGCEPLGL